MTKQEYEQLIEKLNYYTLKYDEGNPEISDKEWDELYYQAVEFEKATGYIHPKSPSATIQFDMPTVLRKVTHNHPMLSLDKTKDINVIKSWAKGNELVAMAKMDGLTCSICYEDGKLVSAETRGNGVIGEDILHNAKVIPSIPKTISNKTKTIIDGEIICKYDDFEEFSDLYKNPRNFASGSIRLLDSSECAKRKLTFVAWDVIEGITVKTFVEKLQWLIANNFITVPFIIDNIYSTGIDTIQHICAKHNYPIDGLVYRINDNAAYLAAGYNTHDWCGSMALKLYDPEYETKLIDIEWSVGKTGTITPIAIFEPVNIDGAKIQRASMHNLTIMKELLGTPYTGQKIWIIRANMVIPQVIRAEKKHK